MEIQLDPALHRLAGNKALYVHLALSFPEDAKSMLAQLNQATADHAAVLHSMKGVAGTVGAAELASRAADLEQQLKQGGRPLDAGTLPTGLDTLVEQTVQALARIVTDLRPAAPGLAAGPFEESELHAMLGELASLLAAGNMRALSVFAKLQYRFGADSALQSSPRLAELTTAVNRLDFAAAQESCRQLDAALSKSDR
ncbi:Hpt domain-containing protein [Uliginosibacterium sp. H3]|uniref:Hpt domain-containing protein n=1 Tax=Uliginosibacterium silvisoli TaxID=3114758 RepID=A0ABU6K083_9RHOO|nr:Hpt domain-containing protein [Uliginosibacterium sp. H3]